VKNGLTKRISRRLRIVKKQDVDGYSDTING